MPIDIYEEMANRVDSNTGKNNAVIVNNNEKDIYQQMASRVDQRESKYKDTISYADTSWGKAILNGLTNFSASNFFGMIPETAETIFDALYNYKTTISKMKSYGMGAFKIAAARQFGYDPNQFKTDQDIDNMLRFEKNMYNTFGTEEGLKRYISENPEQAITDIGMALLPIGEGLKSIGLARTGKAFEFAGSMSDPFNIVWQGARLPFHLTMNTINKIEKLPENLYRRAIKLAESVPELKRERLIQTGIFNESAVTYKSVEKLQNQINELETIKDGLVNSVAGGSYMPFDDIFKGLNDLKITLTDNLSMQPVVKEIEKIENRLRTNKKDYEALTGKSKDLLDPVAANNTRKQLNKELAKAYQDAAERVKMTPIGTDAAMKIQKNIRNFLEAVVPEFDLINYTGVSQDIIEKRFGTGVKKLSFKELNRLQGDLIEIRNAIHDVSYGTTTGRIMDFQVGQKTATTAFVGGSVGRFFTSNPEAITTIMAVSGISGFVLGTIDSSALLKSKLAIYLDHLRSIGVTVQPTATLIRLGLYNATNPDIFSQQNK